MFDESDTLTVQERNARLFDGMGLRLQAAAECCHGLAAHLQGHDLSAINDAQALQRLPVLRKSALMQAQQTDPPFGGFVDMQSLAGQRVFMSPGPVFEPQLPGADPWQGARALHAAGFRQGHRVHNAFSYHQTPGGFILDEAARALGCIVFPAGVGSSEAQVQAIRQYRAQAYVGTPDYLQTLLDVAAADGLTLDSLDRAMVSGGALFPAMRERYSEQGIAVRQCYATADLGVIAYETADNDVVHPGMLVNEGLIVEILIPGTSQPVSPGEVGEIVVTRLSPVYPLVRFATGDLSAVLNEPSPCGRTQMRLRGWLGRADQRTKVRGMFVDPEQLQHLPRDHQELARWRLSISRSENRDQMHLAVVLHGAMSTADENRALIERLSESLQQYTGLAGTVSIVDELPDDGIVVEDQRTCEQY